MTQSDMFRSMGSNILVKYPDHAGAKDNDTGKLAANKITESGRMHTLRANILDMFRYTGQGYTPDDMAAKLNEDILSIRPRFSELKRLGLIVDTGERRNSDNGNPQRVYKLKQ